MPAAIPFIPLIGSALGIGASLIQGHQQAQQNQQAQNQANQSTAAQQQLISQLMQGITPDSYRAQAQQAGQGALSQLASNFAQRGMLSSGALQTAGAQTLGQLYTDANTRYMQDRQSAISTALGGQQSIQRQYGGQINPDPYAGLGQSLGGLGTSLGQYFYNRQTPSTGAYPAVGAGLPGFGAKYPS